MKNIIKYVIITITVLVSMYILFYKTQFYKTESTILLKNLNKEQEVKNLFNFNMNTDTEYFLIEKIILSNDFLLKLNKKFKFQKIYKSIDIDFFNRLSSEVTEEEILKVLKNKITFEFDIPSKSLKIGFLHPYKENGTEILYYIIEEIRKEIEGITDEIEKSEYNTAKKIKEEKYLILNISINKLKDFQEKHRTFSFTEEITFRNNKLYKLKEELQKIELELKIKSKYLSNNNIKVKNLQNQIKIYNQKILEENEDLTKEDNIDFNELNIDFMKLKNEVDFNKNTYIESLKFFEISSIKYNTLSKKIVIISKPYTGGKYLFPNKYKLLFTYLFFIYLIFGILSYVYIIIKEHKN